MIGPYWERTPPTWVPGSEAEYHVAKAPDGGPLHGSSQLRLALSNPSLFFQRYVSGEEPLAQSRPMIVGSMVDDSILQPVAFAETYFRQPDDVKVRKGAGWEDFLESVLKDETLVGDWRAWLTARGAPAPKKPRNGKVADDLVRWGPEWQSFLESRIKRTIVRSADWDLAAKITERVWENPMASALLTGSLPQVCHAWKDPATGIWSKFRIDNATETRVRPAAVDLKTWNVVDPLSVSKRVWNDGIHIQMALYEEGFFDLWGVHPDIFLVIAHSETPFEVAVYQMPLSGYGDEKPVPFTPTTVREVWLNDYERDIVWLDPPPWKVRDGETFMSVGRREVRRARKQLQERYAAMAQLEAGETPAPFSIDTKP